MKKYPILCSLVLLLSMGSCGSEFDYSVKDVDLLEVSSRMVSFSTNDSSRNVEIKSDVEWTVTKTEIAPWLTVQKQPDAIVLSASENSTIVPRETVLLVEAGERKAEIKVKQDCIQPSFTSSKEQILFVHEGGNESVEVTSNVDWEVDTYCDWMVLTKTESGLSIAVSDNPTDKMRTANVDFYNSGTRFASIIVAQRSSVPQPADYYSVDITTVDWGVSYVHYVHTANGANIAVLTKEYVADDDKIHIFMYPVEDGAEDFSKGTDVTADVMYIRTENNKVYDYDPHIGFELVEALGHSPLTLASDVKTHGAVKIGQQIWLAEDYKTTKYVDGTSIPSYQSGQAFWTNGDAVVVIHEGHYNYTAYTIGWNGSKCDDSNFAPDGWAVPDKDQYLELIAATQKNYEDMKNKYLFKATDNFKFTKDKSGKVLASALGYTNTWSCTPSSSKLIMMGMKPDNTSVNSAQAVTACFAVRLIKE